jgi:dTDP-4-amino-4,6-dideoxygalactose transaminase
MNNRIPFCDLTRALVPLRTKIDGALDRVIDKAWFLRGRETEAFEEEWAAYCGQKYCVTCNSGTDALTLAALALGRKTAVIQANTVALTATGLRAAGAKVSVREVDTDGRLSEVGPDAVPVLLYGRPPSQRELNANLFDAAHAHGWKPPKQAIACWSFYPTKTLGAHGDGGAVTTNDADLAETIRSLTGRDDQLRDGRQITSRMDEVQAAVLRVKLPHLDSWLGERRYIAAAYRKQMPKAARPLEAAPDDLNHLFVVRVKDRGNLIEHMRSRGIETKVHFPMPLHRQKADWGDAKAHFPNAEEWCDSVLSLPCYPGLKPDEIGRVCSSIADWAALHPEV